MANEQRQLVLAVLATPVNTGLMQTIMANFLSQGIYVTGRTKDGYSVEDILWRRNVNVFVPLLREHKANVNQNRENTLPPHLLNAVQNGDEDEVRRIVAQTNTPIDYAYLVGVAVFRGHQSLVRYFIEEQHADPNCQCKDGEHPAYIAAENGHLSILQYLQSRGVSLLIPGIKHKTLLHASVVRLTVLEYLLSNSLDVNCLDYNGETLLIHAAKLGRADIATFVIGYSPNLELKDRDGYTALAISKEPYSSPFMQAHDLAKINRSREEVKRIILKHQDELERRRTAFNQLRRLSGETANLANLRITNTDLAKIINPLTECPQLVTLDLSNNELVDNINVFAAELLQRTGIIRILLTNNHLTPEAMALAEKKVNPTERLRLLMEQYQSTEFGREHYQRIVFLIEHGADVKSLAVDDWNLIHFAAYHGNNDLLYFLSIKGINLTATTQDDSKKNVLHLAAERGHNSCIEYLVTVAKGLITTDGEMHSPLYYATSRGHENAVRILLRAGDDPNHVSHGSSLVKIAINNRHAGVLMLLLDNGAVWEGNNNADVMGSLDASIHADAQIIEIINKYENNQQALFEAAREGRIHNLKKLLDVGVNIQIPNELTQSVLYVALQGKHLDCCALLLSAGAEFTAEEEAGNHFKHLKYEERVYIRDRLLEYFKRPSDAVISYLNSRTRLSGQNKFKLGSDIDIKNVYQQLYYQTLNEEYIRPVLEVLEYSPQALDIVFDCSVDNVSRVNPTQGKGSRGACVFEKAKIYIGAKRNFAELLGTTAHELTHLACQQVFNYRCNPYQAGVHAEQQFLEIWREIKNRRQSGFVFETIIDRVFTEYPNETDQPSELIVRVPHMIAEYGAEGISKLTQQAPALLMFYKNCVLPKFNEYVKKQNYEAIRSGATHINILDTLGDISFDDKILPIVDDKVSAKALPGQSVFTNETPPVAELPPIDDAKIGSTLGL